MKNADTTICCPDHPSPLVFGREVKAVSALRSATALQIAVLFVVAASSAKNTITGMKFLGAWGWGIVAIFALVLSPSLAAADWREMLREQIALRQAAPDLSKQFPGLSPEMAQLGEAFTRAAYPDAPELGRKNYLTLVRHLGMASPAPADLRQFLHPNKKPWPDYAGPTDGNFHMLLNSGTLNLDTWDGSSRNHPGFALRKKHSVTAARVKPVTQALAKFIRNEKVDTEKTAGDADAKKMFLQKFRAHWDTANPKAKLSNSETAFVGDMLLVIC